MVDKPTHGRKDDKKKINGIQNHVVTQQFSSV